MAIKILHTADWHLGQMFHQFDRYYEHTQFLDWLVQTIVAEQIDVMLLSGDVFDSSNPSPQSQKLYYKFLGKAMRANPNLQIIITAGNHDSPGRLEAPKDLLNNFGVQVIGKLKKLADGSFNFEKATIPLLNKQNEVEAYCIAIPYLRPADFHHLSENYKKYASYVSQTYKDAYSYVLQNKEPNKGIIAMGHLHTNAADITNENRVDARQVVGGSEHISSEAFDQGLAYVALGHIHKAQRIGGQEHIRYSGSPLPMSFTEKNYGHEVVVFDLINSVAQNIKTIAVPMVASCLAIPKKHDTIDNVIQALLQLPNISNEDNVEMYPYICANILADGPDAERRIKIEDALVNKQARFVKIDLKDKNKEQKKESVYLEQIALNQLQPENVLTDIYAKKYQEEIPIELLDLFKNLVHQLPQI
jgi:DNA repair protein SbcD/Mre11